MVMMMMVRWRRPHKCDVKFSCNMILIIILGELLYAKHYSRNIATKITVETPNVAAYAH